MHGTERTRNADRARPSSDPYEEKDFGNFMESMVTETKDYLGAQKEYYTLVASEKAGRIGGGLLSSMVNAILLGSVLVFFNLALALWIGRLLQDNALGFLLVGGVYLLLLMVFRLIWRGGMRERFTLNIINALYHDKD